ncbi:MAG TPA: ribosome maturation factor RimM [Oculatellaceae cyanobacterium]
MSLARIDVPPQTLSDNPDLLLIGKIVAAHGVKGAVRIKCNERQLSKFKKLKRVIVASKETEQTMSVERTLIVKNMLVTSLENIATKEDADKLLHHFVFCKRSEVSKLEKDEWWVRDLIGLDVYTTEGVLIGNVCDVISTGSDLIEIRPVKSTDGKDEKNETFYVPFVKELVPVVRLDLRRIEVNAIPGLLGDE